MADENCQTLLFDRANTTNSTIPSCNAEGSYCLSSDTDAPEAAFNDLSDDDQNSRRTSSDQP
jgi:hypothetical protein